MEQLASVDGEVLPAGRATVPVTDDGLLRGDGVFEVARLYGGVPFAWTEHLDRLERSARNIRLPVDRDAVEADVAALLDAAGPVDAALRVVLTRGGRRIAIIEPAPGRADAVALRTVTYAPTRILDEIKSLSYGANMLAGRIAQEHGDDEALLVTPHGRVLEAPTSTFFYVLEGGGALCTPPLTDHVLDSITRRRLAGLVELTERVTTTDDLARVSEAFLASTLREVQAVRSIDGRALPRVPGPVTEDVRKRFAAHVRESTGPGAST